MTAFHEQTFTKRFAQMGDASEAAFDTLYPKHHKLGLNRPPFFMGGMNATMRYTPDRMRRDAIIECMGCGRDGILKLKVDKLSALIAWKAIGPVNLFVFHSTTGACYEASIDDWEQAVLDHGTLETFERDDKKYWALNINDFPTDSLLDGTVA